MNLERMDDTFGQGLRSVLVKQVNEASPVHTRWHRWWVGAGIFAGAGLIGGVGAATAGFFTEPGGDVVTQIGSPTSGTFTGSHTFHLGTAPEGATHFTVKLTCLNGAGTLSMDDGGFITCPGDQNGTSQPQPIALIDGQHSTKIRASDPGVTYTAQLTYMTRTETEWAVNENGDTYGAANDRGEPDLLSVIATNGELGYAYSQDLQGPEINNPQEAMEYMENMKGTTLMVPVYESDGETVIGEFQAGSW
jgi:hypothetical protein